MASYEVLADIQNMYNNWEAPVPTSIQVHADEGAQYAAECLQDAYEPPKQVFALPNELVTVAMLIGE